MLIDSHILLWLLQEPEKISPKAKTLLAAHSAYVSAASIWELGLKHSKGKLTFSAQELLVGAKDLGCELIDISTKHIVASTSLKTRHSDPFDKMLMAQAITENLLLLTNDSEILQTALPSLRLIDGRK